MSHSQETKDKISKARKERISSRTIKYVSPMKDKHHSLKTKLKMSHTRKNNSINGIMVGVNHPNWKGDNIKYGTIHDYVKRNKLKSELCEECKKNKPYDLANISGKYKRDVNDFRWLCRSCHMKEDGRLKTLQENHRRKVIGEYYQCSKCKKMLPKKLFYYFNGDKYSSRCKDCYKFYRKSLL